MDPCDQMYREMNRIDRERDGLGWFFQEAGGFFDKVFRLPYILTLANVDGRLDEKRMEDAMLRDRHSYLSRKYDIECLGKTELEPLREPLPSDYHIGDYSEKDYMRVNELLDSGQLAIVGLLVVLSGAEFIRLPSMPTWSPSFGSGVIMTRQPRSLFDASPDGA